MLNRSLATALLTVLAASSVSRAQGVSADSTFLTGRCPTRSEASVDWDAVVTAPEKPPRLVPASFRQFPLHLRRDGYSARIVLAMVIDTAGRVMPGTVGISESTDPRLSAWGCTVAFELRFVPATVGGNQ